MIISNNFSTLNSLETLLQDLSEQNLQLALHLLVILTNILTLGSEYPPVQSNVLTLIGLLNM